MKPILLAVLALFFLMGNGREQLFAQNDSDVQKKDLRIRSDNACAIVSAGIIGGIKNWPPEGKAGLIDLCNNNPYKDGCIIARGYIRFTPRRADEEAGRTRVSYPAPELHCNGYENAAVENQFDRDYPPLQAPIETPEESAASNACDMISASILTGADDHGNLPKWITQCNAHPAKCRDARDFIKFNNEGNVPSGLTCP